MEKYAAKLPKYRDAVFRFSIGVPFAFIFVMYEEKDHTFFEAIMFLNFWIAVVASFIIIQILMLYLNWLQRFLDRHFDWRQRTLERTLLQLLCGIAVPALIAFYLAAFYFWAIFGLNIHDTLYLEFDYTLVLLLLLVANGYYLCYYLWLVPLKGFVPIELAVQHVEATLREQEELGTSTKTMFLAETSDRTIAIPMENIASISLEGNYVLLRTFDREGFTLMQSLSKVMVELDPKQFFRINPRFIVNFKLCRELQRAGNSKQQLILGAPVNRTEQVTRSRVQEFNEWLVR